MIKVAAFAISGSFFNNSKTVYANQQLIRQYIH